MIHFSVPNSETNEINYLGEWETEFSIKFLFIAMNEKTCPSP